MWLALTFRSRLGRPEAGSYEERSRAPDGRLGDPTERQWVLSEMAEEVGRRVTLGSTVTLAVCEGFGEAVKFTLVVGRRADPGRGWISAEAPLAQAVVGRQVGDEVTVQAGRQTRTYKIVAATG
jgi:transcription elongation factor GreA